MAVSPASQGRAFEQAMSTLLDRAVGSELGWQVLQNKVQPGGPQFGKDIQLTFRTPDGRTMRWHVECKSHSAGGSLTKEEVLPKLFDLWRSDHRIDGWMIALASVELGNSLDEMLVALRERLRLPFVVKVFSKGEQAIDQLFACFPDLYDAVYDARTRVDPDAAERERRITAFGRLLTDTAVELVDPAGGVWQMVKEGVVDVEDDSAQFANAYLRGFEPAAWEPIVYGWAVHRSSTVAELVRRVREAPPGCSHTWLVGAAGEGKSTALRQAAWELARSKAIVLWATAEHEVVSFPMDWIEALPIGAQVVLCVDSAVHLRGARALRGASMRFAGQQKSVAMVLVERGIDFGRSPARVELARWTRPTDLLEMVPLTQHEAGEIVTRLDTRGLLRTGDAEAARDRIVRASARRDEHNRSWLIPTLMEVTDEENRNFEQILESVLISLESSGLYAAVQLLLCVSLGQAARHPLPEVVAQKLATPPGLAATLEALFTELRSRNLTGRVGGPSWPLRTNHDVVAEAYVAIGLNSQMQRQYFLDAVEAIVATAADSLDEFFNLDQRQFDLIDTMIRYLLRRKAFEPAARMFQSWVALDPDRRNFQAMQRLGVCLSDWIVAEANKSPVDVEAVQWLQTYARMTFVLESGAIGRLRAAPETVPAQWRRRLENADEWLFHAWAVAESAAADAIGDRVGLRQAVLLSVLGCASSGISPPNLSILALNLQRLGRSEQAAGVVAAYAAISPSHGYSTQLTQQVEASGVQVPSAGTAQLPEIFASLLTGLLLDDDEPFPWPETRDQRVQMLAECAGVLARRLGGASVLQAAQARLLAARDTAT